LRPIREPQAWSGGEKLGLVAGAVGVLAVLFALGAVLHLGPFERKELSQGELLAQGDEICRRAHAAFEELQVKQPQTPDQAAALTGQLLAIAEDERDRLAALDGPDDFDDELQTYLDARELGIDTLRRGHQAAEAGRADVYAEAQAELAETQRQRIQIARQVGFAECSRKIGKS
jgi:hypothetical protein